MTTREKFKEVLEVIGIIIGVILLIIIGVILQRWPLYFILKRLKK